MATAVSLGVPSGLDVTTGATLDPSVRADVTMTLAVPASLYSASFGLDVGDLFGFSDIVRVAMDH